MADDADTASDWLRDYDSAITAPEEPLSPRPCNDTDTALKQAVMRAYCDDEIDADTTARIFQFQPLEAA